MVSLFLDDGSPNGEYIVSFDDIVRHFVFWEKPQKNTKEFCGQNRRSLGKNWQSGLILLVGLCCEPAPYQQRTLDQLYTWWMQRPGITETPIVVMPTSDGKERGDCRGCAVCCSTPGRRNTAHRGAGAQQRTGRSRDAAKLRAMLPSHLSVSCYSASLGLQGARRRCDRRPPSAASTATRTCWATSRWWW